MFARIFIIIPKKYENDSIQISKKNESSLWKNSPNSIYLTAIYKGKTVSFDIPLLNRKTIFAIENIKKIPEMIHAVNVIFLKFCGSFNVGGKKKI